MEEAIDGLLAQSSLLAPTTLIPTNDPVATGIKLRVKRKVDFSSMKVIPLLTHSLTHTITYLLTYLLTYYTKNVFKDGRIDAIINKRSENRGASTTATTQLLLQGNYVFSLLTHSLTCSLTY